MDVTAENLDREWDVAAGPNVGGRGVTREHPPALQKCREHLPPPALCPAFHRRHPLLSQGPSSGWGRGQAGINPALKPGRAEQTLGR